MTADEIRETFLKYFEDRDHSRVASASLVPENDPSLLFTGAGMNQFKDEFLGKGRRGLVRATSSQKCLRTGDLENVGRTAGHQSFFEMLGNFSFGDYFKSEAIRWAWDFLTTVVEIEAEKLSATVYEDDDEAYAIWRDEIELAESRIHRLGAKDNFWPANAPAAGPNGPCGPCSEIFFDYGPNERCPDESKCSPACDCGRFEEIWNLVFTQFDRKEGGKLEPLPQKNIDTGMGFERLVRVLEQAPTNLETSLFRPILDAVARAASRDGYSREGEEGVRMRRVAEHARAACFLIGDGVRPGNEGREYVLRRILRRAVRDGAGLGIERPFLADLVPAVVESMGRGYPELLEGVEVLERVLTTEEDLFRRTFQKGMRRLTGAIGDLRKEAGTELPGDVVFQLHDTFGFPVDVTAEILQEEELGFDRTRFDELMQEQRERSRAAAKMTDDIFERGPLGELAARGAPETEFVGYDSAERATPAERRGVEASAVLLGVLDESAGELREHVEPGQEVTLVLDRTPFYAESGGQIGDQGELRFEGGVLRVSDTREQNGYCLHRGRFEGSAPARNGQVCRAVVDAVRRDSIRRNHTATHLLHKALKDLLGDTVQQAGSLVAPDRLRFDFTLDRGLTPEEIVALEDAVNAQVLENTGLRTELLGVEEAKQSGAVALFGEKYPDPVRVVSVGDYSRELCGGTHCRAAGDIGLFRVTTESSIAAGVRRIEAVTGAESLRRMQEERGLLGEVARQLGVPPQEVPERVTRLGKDLKQARKRATSAGPAFEAIAGEPVGGGPVPVYVHLLDRPREEIVAAANAVVKRPGGAVAVLLVTTHGGKVAAVCAGNETAVGAGFDATRFLRGAGGRGGGRPPLAQGTIPGEPTLEKLRAAALEALAAG